MSKTKTVTAANAAAKKRITEAFDEAVALTRDIEGVAASELGRIRQALQECRQVIESADLTPHPDAI